MNKFTYLLLAALAIVAVGCSNANEKAVSATDTHQGDPYETTTNIRYVNTDSIGQYYVFAQEVKTQLEQIALDVESKRNTYQNQLVQKGNNIEQKAKSNGYLSQQSYEQDVAELNKLQNYYAQQLQQLEMQASQKAAVLQAALADSINNFVTEYNKAYHYDAILDRQVALYFNPALDITKEVIEGLNARYMDAGKPAAAVAEPAK